MEQERRRNNVDLRCIRGPPSLLRPQGPVKCFQSRQLLCNRLQELNPMGTHSLTRSLPKNTSIGVGMFPRHSAASMTPQLKGVPGTGDSSHEAGSPQRTMGRACGTSNLISLRMRKLVLPPRFAADIRRNEASIVVNVLSPCYL